MQNYRIGYISKAHGIKGEVLLKLFDKEDSFVKEGIKVFMKGGSYLVKGFRRSKDGLIVRLEGVETRNDSELLKGQEVSVEASLFAGVEGDGFYLNQLLGFEVYLDEELMGCVAGFAETAAHDLLRVKLSVSKEEVEIPYVDDFISNINNIERKIHVNCPLELFDSSFINGSKK